MEGLEAGVTEGVVDARLEVELEGWDLEGGLVEEGEGREAAPTEQVEPDAGRVQSVRPKTRNLVTLLQPQQLFHHDFND